MIVVCFGGCGVVCSIVLVTAVAIMAVMAMVAITAIMVMATTEATAGITVIMAVMVIVSPLDSKELVMIDTMAIMATRSCPS